MAKLPCVVLRDARKRSGKSQEQVADDLEVTQPCISKWETGDSIPPPGDAIRIAAAYEVNPKVLLRSVQAALESRAREAREAKAS